MVLETDGDLKLNRDISTDTIQRAIQRDESAFQQIVETFQTPVYNMCYRMLLNEREAEDAAQETFWKTWTNLVKYDISRPFGTWILSIAAHHCIDLKRKKQVAQVEIDETMEEIIPDSIPGPKQEMAASERERDIQLYLQYLSDTDRAMIVMRYWNELSDKEIAAAMSMSESAVKSRLFRARRQLADVINRQKAAELEKTL